MPHIVAYHPSVGVKLSDGVTVVISGDVSDWMDDEEFIGILYRGFKTLSVDRVVDCIRRGGKVAGVSNLVVR